MREIATVWLADARRQVRSARVIVLLALYGMFSGLALLVVGSIARAVRAGMDRQIAASGASEETARQALTQARSGMLGFLFSEDQAMIEALSRVPMVVLIVFKLTLFFLPAYVALMGFDQLSGEVGPRSIRYLTVRARRSSVLLGKFLAQASILLALVLLIDLGVFVYAQLTNEDFTLGQMIPSLLKFWLAATVFSLAYLALTTLCSTLFRTPAVSLIFNLIMLFVFWLLDAVGSRARIYNLSVTGEEAERTPLEILRFLSPSSYAADLLHPRLAEFGTSAGAYAGFAALFLAAAYLVLRRRDL